LEYDATTGAFIRIFVPAGSGGLRGLGGAVFGPDGNFYVASTSGGPPTSVLRYNGQTGAFIDVFVPAGSGGAVNLNEMVFGPNGNLFVSDFGASNVKEYDGTTGMFIKVFASTHVASNPEQLVFGPDGNLYLADESDVEEFDGTTGALIKAFPPGADAAARLPDGVAFGPDGSLYVSTAGPCCPDTRGEILKYNPMTGALMGLFVPPGSGGLGAVGHIAFHSDGYLYVTSGNTAGSNNPPRQIMRYDATTGAFVDVFIPPGSGGLNNPLSFTFAPSPTTPLPTPTFTKAFSPSVIQATGGSTLTFTITNPNGVPLTGGGFTDPLPAGLAIGSFAGFSVPGCGAGAMFGANGTTISLSNATIPAGGTCTAQIAIIANAPGVYMNTSSTVTSKQAAPGGPATDTLTVVLPPTIDKAFAVSQLQLFGPNSTTLTFTLTNPGANPTPLIDIEFTDTLPAVVVVSTPNGLTSTCSPTAPTAVPGSQLISLPSPGATLAPGGSCTISVNVTAVAIGAQLNTTSAVAAFGGAIIGSTATASVAVDPSLFMWFFLESGGGGGAH